MQKFSKRKQLSPNPGIISFQPFLSLIPKKIKITSSPAIDDTGKGRKEEIEFLKDTHNW